jgi:hypothetical protein
MLVDGEIATVDDAATFSPLDRPEAVADRIAVFARATTATA